MLPVTELPFLILYMALTGLYLLVFWRQVLAGPWPVLAATLAIFAASYVVDLFWVYHLRYLLEEGFKLLGQAGWMGYFALVAAQPIRACLRADARAAVTRRQAGAAPGSSGRGASVIASAGRG